LIVKRSRCGAIKQTSGIDAQPRARPKGFGAEYSLQAYGLRSPSLTVIGARDVASLATIGKVNLRHEGALNGIAAR
jgi:hypothetical protein